MLNLTKSKNASILPNFQLERTVKVLQQRSSIGLHRISLDEIQHGHPRLNRPNHHQHFGS